LICVVHGLVIHGTPLLKVRSSNLIKLCTPGGGQGDCGLRETCDSAADCINNLPCYKGRCQYARGVIQCTPGDGNGACRVSQTCVSTADCKEDLICFKSRCQYPLA
ncbi:15404_t:CDS:2, partial [Cetraspora pellucida]